ncbi:hypothetical protein NLJ89_g8299 [Agrocybe chaxingu]|uniref:F-box domain-containing protein n=1 Tax=Agrocybe chaxingu TaxID=84603 RepID=A0A9W8JVI3_9AGAR|nr:hypothetical protein NLJ89_g8299 [Agrocybe chaxingu]
MSTKPAGWELSVEDLLSALKWKLEVGDDGFHDHASISSSELANWWNMRQQDSASSRYRRPCSFPQKLSSPINRVPVEILGRIMLFLQPQYGDAFLDPDDAHRLRPSQAHSWIKITHVCKCLRAAALNNPSLWRSINLATSVFPGSGALGMAFLERSKPFTIDLYHKFVQPLDSGSYERYHVKRWPSLPTMFKEVDAFYYHLRKIPERIRSLYLKDEITDVAWAVFRDPLPNLQTLHIAPRSSQWDGTALHEFIKVLPIMHMQRLGLPDFLVAKVLPWSLTHLAIVGEDYGPLEIFTFPMNAELVWDAYAVYEEHDEDENPFVPAFLLPPQRYMEQVIGVLFRPEPRGALTLCGTCLLIEEKSLSKGHGLLRMVAAYLPNVSLLGFGSVRDLQEDFLLLRVYSTVEHLEFYGYESLSTLLIQLQAEDSEAPKNRTILPKLSKITVYIGDKSLADRDTLEHLSPLRRPHLETAYTLEFKTGSRDSAIQNHRN